MAKNKTAAPPTPGATIAAPAADAPHGARSVQRGVSAVDLADQVGDVVAGTARVVQTVLPNRLPVFLGVGALLLLGVVDPPIALAGGLTYEALRRWTPRR